MRNPQQPAGNNEPNGTLLEEEEPANYKVGYRKPPLHSQFKPGQSGNPRRNKRGARSIAEEISDALKKPVNVKENGRSRKISVVEAGLAVLRQKALSGNLPALYKLLEYAERHAPSAFPADIRATLAEDEQIIELFRQSLNDKRGFSDDKE